MEVKLIQRDFTSGVGSCFLTFKLVRVTSVSVNYFNPTVLCLSDPGSELPDQPLQAGQGAVPADHARVCQQRLSQ